MYLLFPIKARPYSRCNRTRTAYLIGQVILVTNAVWLPKSRQTLIYNSMKLTRRFRRLHSQTKHTLSPFSTNSCSVLRLHTVPLIMLSHSQTAHTHTWKVSIAQRVPLVEHWLLTSAHAVHAMYIANESSTQAHPFTHVHVCIFRLRLRPIHAGIMRIGFFISRKGSCSMFGANSSATPDGSLLQLRALDWNVDGEIRKLCYSMLIVALQLWSYFSSKCTWIQYP